MKANPLMRVLAAKAAMFVGLALIVAVVVGIMSVAFVDTSSMAQTQPPNPPAQPNIGAEAVINQNASGGYPIEGTYTSKGGTLILYVSGSGWSANAGSKIGTRSLSRERKKAKLGATPMRQPATRPSSPPFSSSKTSPLGSSLSS